MYSTPSTRSGTDRELGCSHHNSECAAASSLGYRTNCNRNGAHSLSSRRGCLAKKVQEKMKYSRRHGRFQIRQDSSRRCRSRHTRLSLVTAAWLLPFNVAFAQEPTLPPAVGLAALPRDLSPWGMFMNADVVVKAVMVGLV